MLVCLYGTIHESPQRCNAYGPPHQNEEKGFDMTAKNLPPVEELRKLLRYEPETGKLFWRKRGNTTFDNIYAGKEALSALTYNGYRRGTILGQSVYAHRAIWKIATGEEPPQIDHINHSKADNRWENLRATNSEGNAKNHPMYSNNTSGVTGVSRCSRRNQWQVSIRANGKSVYLGRFHRKEDAIKARLEAEIRYGFHMNHGR